MDDRHVYPLSRIPGDIGRVMRRVQAPKNSATGWNYYPIFWAQQTWLLRNDYHYLDLSDVSPQSSIATAISDGYTATRAFNLTVTVAGQSLGWYRLANQMEGSFQLLGAFGADSEEDSEQLRELFGGTSPTLLAV